MRAPSSRRFALGAVFALAATLLVAPRALSDDVPPDVAEIQAKLRNREGLTDEERRRLLEWTMRRSNQTDRDIGNSPTEDQNVAMPKDVQEIIARAQATGRMSDADKQRLKEWGAQTKRQKRAILNDANDTPRLLQQSPPVAADHPREPPPRPSDNVITVEIKQHASGRRGEWTTTGTLTVPVVVTVEDNPNDKSFHLKFSPSPTATSTAQLHASGWSLQSDGDDPAGQQCPEHRDTFDLVVSGTGSLRDPRVSLFGEVVTPLGRRAYTNAQVTFAVPGPEKVECACNAARNKTLPMLPMLAPVTLDNLRGDVPFNLGMGDLPMVGGGQRLMDRADPATREAIEQAFFNFDTAGARRAIDEGGDFSTASTYHYKMAQPDGALLSSTVTFRFQLKFPKKVCGPDITDALGRTMEKLRRNFRALPDDTKASACRWAAAPTAAMSWDILGIHDRHEWIDATHPTCDVGGPNSTVEVGGQCFYTGSVNYVLWGVMFGLCAELHSSLFTEDVMLEYISAYKGGVVKGAANWGPSQWWARAGYEGWPAAPTPAGDRPKQKCSCPKSLGQEFPSNDGHRTFLVGWFPTIDPLINAPLP